MQSLTERQMTDRRNLAVSSLKISVWIEVINSVKDFTSFMLVGCVFILKKLTVGDFVLCINSASTLFNNASSIIRNSQELLKCSVYADNFVKFLNFSESRNTGMTKPKKANHIIELRNVSFIYPGSNDYVLKNINLTLKPNETVALVGVNGSGKTTLIKLLCRLYEVTNGEILLDGVNVQNYNIDEYRNLFSPIFQDFKLFAFSLKENICLSKQFDKKMFESVLEKVELREFVENLSFKENTYIEKGFSDNGIELSGGQKQRVAIARAYYNNSSIFIMDEPTASLDYLSEETVYKQLEAEKSTEIIKLLISHRLYSCKFCERIVVFDDGMIAAIGTHKELLKKNALYRGLFYEQAKNYEMNS